MAQQLAHGFALPDSVPCHAHVRSEPPIAGSVCDCSLSWILLFPNSVSVIFDGTAQHAFCVRKLKVLPIALADLISDGLLLGRQFHRAFVLAENAVNVL